MRDTEPSARSWRNFIGDFFLPPGCLSCGSGRARAFEGGICRPCWARLPARSGPHCSRCDLPIAAAGAGDLAAPECGRCLVHPPQFDRLRAAVSYTGTAPAILKAFKYGGADYLAPHLARRIAALFEPGDLPDAVAPIPATRRELRDRGYFPAGDLARDVSRLLGAAFVPKLLCKRRETERQARLPLSRRAANVEGAFTARSAPKTVLLVDDVATSGATLSAAARALRIAGAKNVLAAAFARALPEEP